jgi:hypothetical protein
MFWGSAIYASWVINEILKNKSSNPYLELSLTFP